MDERDELALIAEVEAEHGLEAGAVQAAFWVLKSAEGVRMCASLYHPDDGFVGADDYVFDESVAARELAAAGAELLRSLKELHRYLLQEPLWESLCMANATPASIGSAHGPCYCEAAFRLGDRHYTNLYVPIDPHFHFVDLPLSEFPPITVDDILNRSMGGAAGFARCAASLSEAFDIELAREHLAKELLRSTGKVPHAFEIGHRGATSPNDPRDKWMYAEKAAGKTHGEILTRLAKDHREWEQLDNEQSVGKAIDRFCDRTKRPLLRRKKQG